MRLTITLFFAALCFIFAAGYVMVATMGKTKEQREQSWKPALMSIMSAIAAMVAHGCL